MHMLVLEYSWLLSCLYTVIRFIPVHLIPVLFNSPSLGLKLRIDLFGLSSPLGTPRGTPMLVPCVLLNYNS